MAAAAILFRVIFRINNAHVNVLVAIGTAAELQRIGEAALVTGFAVYRYVLINQREIGLAVLKVVHAGHGFEGLFRMAVAAVRAEFALVLVGMTACAVIKLNSGKCLKFLSVDGLHLVAFGTVHQLMLAAKRVLRLLVIEFGSRLERIDAMTVCTACRKRFLVIILVAVEAFRTKAQVSIGFFLMSLSRMKSGLWQFLHSSFRWAPVRSKPVRLWSKLSASKLTILKFRPWWSLWHEAHSFPLICEEE